MKRIVHAVNAGFAALNGYFFDVEQCEAPNEPPDYVGAALFYGVMALMLGILAILTLVTFSGA